MPNRILEQPRAACGFVYFIETEDSAYVKIGFSRDVRKRLATLQIAYPCVFRLLGWIPGDLKTERRLHRTLAQHRHNGEWFRNNKDVRKAIESFTLHREPLDQLPVRGAERYDSAAQELPEFEKQFRNEQLTFPEFERRFSHIPKRIHLPNGKIFRKGKATWRQFERLSYSLEARFKAVPIRKEVKSIMALMRPYAKETPGITYNEVKRLESEKRGWAE